MACAFISKRIVAALLVCVAFAAPAAAQEASDLDTLMTELADPDNDNWRRAERKVIDAWSRSGSDSMDFLLQRGRDAIEEEEWASAIDHLSALIDHAPDFAEAFHARATAFYQQDRFGLAMNDIGAALALNPDHFGALSGLAVILQRTGNSEAALEVWRRVEAIHPHLQDVDETIERLEKETGATPL
ncbi:tetratricopeptide repeat protein [Anianabacter salinae]|uniref:tetratricopeptide repeat protein n=1 Tax=Anianabacter salinae TaxID=2851023 RepID=UPI00225DE1A2|nr:hypothetical protein [Anianabacter salinae]